MRFRYFDPFEQSVVEGDLADGGEVAALVGRVATLHASCAPALELTGADGSSLVLGIDGDRAVVLWTGTDGTTRHSIGGRVAERAMFDWFGACTQMPGHWAVPLAAAVDAAGGYVDAGPGGARGPALAMAVD